MLVTLSEFFLNLIPCRADDVQGHGGGCRYLVKHYPGFVNNLLHFLSHSSNKLDSMTGEVGNLEKAGGHVKEVAICFPLDKDLIILIKT